MPQKTLRLILGDQLNERHSWFSEVDDSVTYLLAETREESTYVRHHIQKVVGFFLAMRTFATQLRKQGHPVIYVQLDDHPRAESFATLIPPLVQEQGFERFEYQLPDEYRLDQQLKRLAEELPVPCEAVDTGHFLTTREELGAFFQGKKQFLMESFYRSMRRKYGILMEGNEPATGRWNYDAENRKKLPKGQPIPQALTYKHDVTDLVTMINGQGIETIGTVQPKRFVWPSNRTESLELLEFFVTHCLPDFGTYQDALSPRDWSLFHSRLSFSMNTKMLHPLEVVGRALQAREENEAISMAQLEGFIRQIIGWREYMRGIYWLKMPEYAELNFFEHDRKLPEWFWTGETDMACLSHAIGQSLEYAYAHHIQRLMVTGNFALLAGIDPDEVDAWYLGIYIDAIEWVEITNTRGMSQFADGGIVGTKPYVSSASYLHKMGHYCGDCKYDPKVKTGENACPFNSLYWHFYNRHADKLQRNPRIGMMYRTWEKMGKEKQQAYLEQAEHYLENLETL
ncbi:MAG: cryptochrome/photolyase family protein [Leptolyngbya sp. SIO3F4]|nr:cryptochrome/photolyase family protein [Leptolyngbya sp. SIO3F4]